MLRVSERWKAGGRAFATLSLHSFRKAPMALGPWRAPASLFCWLVAALSAAPVAALAWRAGWDGFAELPLWIGNGVSNSLLPAALAATVRSEERRVGKECFSTCRSGGMPSL